MEVTFIDIVRYHGQRAADERRRAAGAETSAARRIHDDLARLHETRQSHLVLLGPEDTDAA